MNRTTFTQLLHAATVIMAFAALVWCGGPAFFDALAPLANVPWPASFPSLHAMVAGAVMVSLALSAPRVYRALLIREATDRELFLRSLTITGQLP